MQDVISRVSETLFTNMGIEYSSLEVQVQEEERNIYMVKIQTEESALLIGPHGKTLLDIQSLLTQIAEHETESRCLIHLEINDYLESKDRKLYALVDRKIADAKSSGGSVSLGNLTGYERKKVHAYVSEQKMEWLDTHSEDGADGSRVLYIAYDGPDAADALDLDAVEI